MNAQTRTRRYLSIGLWAAALLAVYLAFNAWIAPNTGLVSLTREIVVESASLIGRLVLMIFLGMGLLQAYLYLIFYRKPSSPAAAVVVRGLQIALAVAALLAVLVFLSDVGGLFDLGEGPAGRLIRYPSTAYAALKEALEAQPAIGKGSVGTAAALLLAGALLLVYAVIYALSQPRVSRLGLAYMLIAPALVGIGFLIIYPFLFEIRLAFSNASLGTQAIKNAQFGPEFGWKNLTALFTGNVAKEAKFFEVLFRTILWTAINVTFHVGGGMALALLLHRPMKLQGVYRTLLVFPWAIPTTIAAMALRNEFDSRYGLFNILLGNLHGFLGGLAERTASLAAIGPSFAWLAESVGPVSWKQDPFWAFVSVLIANIWLGIPFMSVVILGGLQSISHEYYEAAEIDGASKWQQFRNITLPLLRPVLTPVIILGTVWTFNRFDVIYLITQGGPQEKTDILVSSMYKAAFSFYRYGFTAMFALVIFLILLAFSLIYIRMSGGLKTAYE